MSERSGAKVMANAVRNEASDEVVESADAASAAVSGGESDGAVREIPVSAIESDPAQPRRVFDEEKLRRLAESIRRFGLLQEPGVVQIGDEGRGEPRYRLIWGERRWRASQLAGLARIRCKVFPAGTSSAVEQLRRKEQQWAENAEREGLSPIEEAIAIRDAAELERTLQPEVPLGDLIEKIGAGRGLHRTVARNLVALLKTPDSLQSALLARSIKREVGFELARLWNKLLAQNNVRGGAKRETQYRNLVASWARARGLELGAQAMTRYAAETFQDPSIVKATCRKAEESERALLARFDDVVTRATKERWTVAKTKAEVAALRRDAADARPATASPTQDAVEGGSVSGRAQAAAWPRHEHRSGVSARR
jgi:ParB/RepB/Spo0J family partition protein